MFFQILVTILAHFSVGLGEPGMESAFGFGATGGFNYGGSLGTGYGSNYGYAPHLNEYQGFSTPYVPGRPNPLLPFARKSVSPIDSLQAERLLPTSYRNPIIPQSYFYQQYQRYINPAFPYFTSERQTPITTKYIPYYSVPFIESIDTYKFYNPSNSLQKNKEKGGLNLDYGMEMDASNKTRNGSLEYATNGNSLKEDTAPQEEPTLQLTYLGYVPQSSFRSISQHITEDEARQRIPFYILDYDDGSSGIARSSSGPPTMYVSPTRLPLTNYPSRNTKYTRPILSLNSGSIPQQIPYQQFYPQYPIHTGSVVSPYRSAPSYRSRSSDDRAGYYLVDVNPVARGDAELPSEPMLRAPRPTMPLIQTITGAMGGLFPSASRGLSTNTQSQSGFHTGEQNVNKVEQEKFQTGYETHLPHGQAYSNYQSNKEVSVQKYDEGGRQGFNNAYGTHSFGTPGSLG